MASIDRSLTFRFTIMFAIMIVIMIGLPLKAAAQNECAIDAECEAKYRQGSVCLESGQCSNPFAGGCLKRMDRDGYRNRLCNSDDKDQENCRVSPFNYPEIRVHNADWEAGIFFSWILQVCLMELLDVPVTVGLGDNTNISSFYNIENSLPYSRVSYPWDALEKANEVGGDCLSTEEDCVHVLPDVWSGQSHVMQKEFEDGQLDYLDGNGQVAKYSWYVPSLTASRRSFSVTQMGLAEDRQRLAKYFKRPTRWVDYCHEVSKTNCSVPDGVADRYPDEGRTAKYFADGYIGHFRDTAKNNCTGIENGATCTGHIVAPPCSWSTYVEAQAYWNNIALESDGPTDNGGYSYSEMTQIWYAANATKSDIIISWFEPDVMVERFRDTDFQFTKVFLPTPSMKCEETRVSEEDKCGSDPKKRRGEKSGSCDTMAHVTKKAIATSLRDMTLSSSAAEQSPAYYFIQNFNIDQLQVSEMLRHFGDGGSTGYAAREAVCGWIANNESHLKSLIPPNHPRVFQYRDDYKQDVTIAAYSVGGLAILYILASLMITYRKRKVAVFVYAQVQFIFLVLFGLLLVAIGAVLYCIEPNDNICMIRVWLVSLGYSFELAPLIIKVTALNRLMKASKKMRRMKINLNHMYSSLLALSIIATIYLVVWTVMDPSRSVEIRILEEDSIVVTSYFGCRSESTNWQTAYHFWEGLLILWTSVLAFQSRTTKAEFNESKSLGMMTYSHFVFLILRIAVSQIFDDDDPYTSSITKSFMLSLDIIVALTIYLLPKMLMSAETTFDRRHGLHLSFAASSIPGVINKTSSRRPLSFATPTAEIFAMLDETTSYQPKADLARSISSTTAPSQSHEEAVASDTKQMHMKESKILTHGERANMLTNSERACVGNCNDSVDYDDSVPIPDNAPRVEFPRDADDEQLRERLLQSYQENSELKETVRILQETQTRQESIKSDLGKPTATITDSIREKKTVREVVFSSAV